MGCSIALHNCQLIYFALSFTHLLVMSQDNDLSCQDMVTAASNSLMVLPYNVKLGKCKKPLETLFDIEYKTFSELLSLCDSSVIVKQNKVGHPSEICGLVAFWKVETLRKSTATDLCSRFFAKLLKCDKFNSVIKIFASSAVLLDGELLDNILEAFRSSEEAQSVILVANEKNESLIRFLKLRKFEELKTDCLMSGQEILCKTL